MKHTDTLFIRRALEQADLSTLRMALYQATRDPEIAAMKPEAKTVRGGAGVSYQLPETYRQTLVEKGLEFLTGDGVSYEPHVPEDGDLRFRGRNPKAASRRAIFPSGHRPHRRRRCRPAAGWEAPKG